MPYGIVNADQIQSSVSGVSLGAGNASIMKNRIINGAMVVNQRATAVTAAAYSVDRWFYNASASTKATVSQDTSIYPTGFNASLKALSSSAYSVGATDYFGLYQSIEGFNVADLGWGTASAKTVTLSFQVYSSLTGTFGGSINNSGYSRSYPFSYTVPVANTWTTVSVTITGDTTGTWLTNNGIGMTVNFSLGTGSTYSGTAGAWSGSTLLSATGATSVVGTNGATFYITGVQLEVGSSATGFEYRQYGQELALCHRYYETSNGISTPTSVTGGFAGTPYGGSLAQAYGMASFRVTKRASPTIVLYDDVGAAGTCYQPGIALGISGSALGVNTGGFAGINRTSGTFNGTSGYPVQAGYTASAEL